MFVFLTEGTQTFLNGHGISSTRVSKIAENLDGSSVEIIKEGHVDLVFNLSEARDHADEKIMRRTSLSHQVPFISTVEAFDLLLNLS